MANTTDPTFIWKDRKHLLWFPLSFTKYEVKNDRLYSQTGLLHTTFDEVLLYRITDIRLTRTLGQKLCGTGTIELCTKLDHEGHVLLQNIKHPKEVKDLLSDKIEEARSRKNVVGKEFYGARGPAPHLPPDLDEDGDGIPDFEEDDE